MTLKEKIKTLLARARPSILRIVYLAFILSFLLPFVTVRGCKSQQVKLYNGYELIIDAHGGGWVYLVPICIFAAYFIISFIIKNYSKGLKAFGASWGALGAGLSGLVLFYYSQLQFLFDTVSFRIGFYLAVLCAAAVFAYGIAVSLKGFSALRKDRQPEQPGARSSALVQYHYGIAVFSLLLVPVYFFQMRYSVVMAFCIFVFLSLPFILSQLIVVESVRQGEGWPGRWAVAVFILALAMLALVILSFT